MSSYHMYKFQDPVCVHFSLIWLYQQNRIIYLNLSSSHFFGCCIRKIASFTSRPASAAAVETDLLITYPGGWSLLPIPSIESVESVVCFAGQVVTREHDCFSPLAPPPYQSVCPLPSRPYTIP